MKKFTALLFATVMMLASLIYTHQIQSTTHSCIVTQTIVKTTTDQDNNVSSKILEAILR